MEEIVSLVRRAQDNDQNAMEELLDRFRPLIRNCYWRIDTRIKDNLQDLRLKFIEVVKRGIDFSRMNVVNDAVMVSYLSKSLQHHIIKLSKTNKAIKKHEVFIEDVINLVDMADEKASDRINDIFVVDFLQSILKGSEFNYAYYKIVLGYRSKEIAAAFGVSKQAVSQGIGRAMDKLRQFISMK